MPFKQEPRVFHATTKLPPRHRKPKPKNKKAQTPTNQQPLPPPPPTSALRAAKAHTHTISHAYAYASSNRTPKRGTEQPAELAGPGKTAVREARRRKVNREVNATTAVVRAGRGVRGAVRFCGVCLTHDFRGHDSCQAGWPAPACCGRAGSRSCRAVQTETYVGRAAEARDGHWSSPFLWSSQLSALGQVSRIGRDDHGRSPSAGGY
ncbi:uncharacterized protein K452DRAFT_363059 [Aplosporella prunicola CBS 121167]|uniref:Uncharacterized protein n=1 Tax=Aplosporella prunicola CBS 121167 TaxID=1176127 RepID=A0A6A6AUK0_9PEZI|nr:uncharacterized protein K452DRAFT_314053 [Aplosporella prunicola CBS 121167]XP_033391327.1 uncharacterized protein K452DRAFT_363059 [Aplosporella prunicola CBS 121167]KAF2135367.1 hypothetical protein K452DRAFT_314053 [Aplosporella prunicola CBS 121167]KAF2135609.1 hypothetical protein K452DRAFT_363059 [Aplosporella prunicola CBS 121167]